MLVPSYVSVVRMCNYRQITRLSDYNVNFTDSCTPGRVAVHGILLFPYPCALWLNVIG